MFRKFKLFLIVGLILAICWIAPTTAIRYWNERGSQNPFKAWADTFTTILNLDKPSIGSTNWGTNMNNNLDTIDTAWGKTQNFTKCATLLDWTDTTLSGKIQFEMGQNVHLTRAYCNVLTATNMVVNFDKRSESSPNSDTGNHLLGSDLTCTTTGANTSTFANGASQCGGTSSCAVALHNNIVLTITSQSGGATGDAARVCVEGTIDPS